MKILLLIMNCQKYRHKALRQKDDWLKKLPPFINYYHVIGDKNKTQEQNYLIDQENKILYVNTLDDYNSLPHKVITSFEIIKDSDYQYIFKTDDDQRLKNKVFFNKLIKILEANTYYYGGNIVRVNEHKSDYYHVHPELPHNVILEAAEYCNGRFYILHREAIENLLEKKEKIAQRYIEDHAIGYHLDEQFKKPILKIHNDKYFKDY